MSYRVENTIEEIDYLINGTITKVAITEEDEFGEQSLELTVRLPEGSVVVDQHGTKMRTVRIQVWCDEEGNGPGYLAFVGGHE